MAGWENIDDVEVLKRAQDGDTDAYGELYERYANRIFRFLYSRLNDRLDAEDLTEEVFIRVWRSLPNFRHQGVPFAAYLYQVARNALIDHVRHAKLSGQSLEIEDRLIASQDPGPAEAVADHLEHQELREVLGHLRDDYREVLVLRFLSELSPEETAQVMERSVGAVRVLQHRALAVVRNYLDKYQGE